MFQNLQGLDVSIPLLDHHADPKATAKDFRQWAEINLKHDIILRHPQKAAFHEPRRTLAENELATLFCHLTVPS
jgi:hypothetical protein